MQADSIPHPALAAGALAPRAASRRSPAQWLLARLRAWRMEAELALVEPRLLEDAGIRPRRGAAPLRLHAPMPPPR